MRSPLGPVRGFLESKSVIRAEESRDASVASGLSAAVCKCVCAGHSWFRRRCKCRSVRRKRRWLMEGGQIRDGVDLGARRQSQDLLVEEHAARRVVISRIHGHPVRVREMRVEVQCGWRLEACCVRGARNRMNVRAVLPVRVNDDHSPGKHGCQQQHREHDEQNQCREDAVLNSAAARGRRRSHADRRRLSSGCSGHKDELVRRIHPRPSTSLCVMRSIRWRFDRFARSRRPNRGVGSRLLQLPNSQPAATNRNSPPPVHEQASTYRFWYRFTHRAGNVICAFGGRYLRYSIEPLARSG